jgi:hypothetical protein
MNKHDKPVEIELKRGAILPGELLHLLTVAARGANCMLITLSWSDGYQAVATGIDDIEPIEDVEHVKSVLARFRYDDKSSLTIWLRQSDRNTIEAVGDQARQRQSSMAQYWASLPQRSLLAYLGTNVLRSVPIALSGGAITFFVAGLFFHPTRHFMALWDLRVGFLLIALCSYLFVRSTYAIRTFSRLVVLARRRRSNMWTVVAGISAIATLFLGLIAYLFPR